MSNPLFGIDIAGIVKSALGTGQLLPGKLIRRVAGAREDDNLSAGPKMSEKKYNCQGVISSYHAHEVRVQGADKKIILIAGTLPTGIVPAKDDRIEMEKVVHTIVDFTRDPAIATYTCHVRSA